MRSLARRALALGAIAATTIAWSGCSAKQQTEYVAGISTQVTVPRDLKAIVINVSVGGVQQFCRAYTVYNGRVQLPRSLGEFAAAKTPSAVDPITVSVVGLAEELDDTSTNPLFTACEVSAAKVSQNNVRILRRSRQPYVLEEVLFLPMPLKFACFDKDCTNDNETCKAGRCESVVTDQTLLPRYRPDLVDGTGSACFAAKDCFAGSVPAVLVDPNDCTYALPNTPSAPSVIEGAPANPIMSAGEGINVEIIYDGGYTREIIDKDPIEGFLIPDPAKPQRFRLGPGLCDMVKGVDPQGNATPHRITAIRATGLCQAKSPFQPLCLDDALAAMGTPGEVATHFTKLKCSPTELKPAKSVLMIVADDTENNGIFYTGGGASGTGGADIAKSDLVSAALADPAFKNTYIGLSFFPGGAGAACSPHPVAVAPDIATKSRPGIVSAFTALKAAGSLKPKDSALQMTGALDDAYNALKLVTDANRRAVLVIGNRSFDANTCGGTPTARATTARSVDKIDTYVALLARDQFVVPEPDPPPFLPGAQTLAEAGAPAGSGAHAFDARKDKDQANDALRKIVDDLATCAYDVDPAKAPTDDVVLTYSDPVAIPAANQPAFASIVHDATCTADGTTGNGWGYNATTHRIHVCGQACTSYRTTLRNAAGYAAQYGQPSLAVPLFAHQGECAPKP